VKTIADCIHDENRFMEKIYGAMKKENPTKKKQKKNSDYPTRCNNVFPLSRYLGKV